MSIGNLSKTGRGRIFLSLTLKWPIAQIACDHSVLLGHFRDL